MDKFGNLSTTDVMLAYVFDENIEYASNVGGISCIPRGQTALGISDLQGDK